MSPTPNITAGVTELVKPRSFAPNVAWRAETTLANGASILSPVFDVVGDGFPYNQAEVAALAVSIVRVSSPRFLINCRIDTNNMKLQIFLVNDPGSQSPGRTLYVPSIPGSEVKGYRYVSPARRCQFRLLNTPLGASPGVNTSIKIEVINEA